MATSAGKGFSHLQRLFPRCTFRPALGHLQSLRSELTYIWNQRSITIAHNNNNSRNRNISISALSQPQRHFYTTKSPTANTIDSIPWTKDDDKLLTVLRKKKSSLAQIQIFMPHQPIATIEAKIKEHDTRTKPKPTFQRWTPEEDQLLTKAVQDLGIYRWSDISDIYFSPDVTTESASVSPISIGKRSPRSCQIRWKFLHPDESASSYNTGPWSPEELELFQELVNPSPTADNPNHWDEISRAIGTRSANQCHSQFKSVMHSGTKGKWTVEEVNRLLEAHELYGGDWQKVSEHVGTRAPGQVRQKWNQFSEDVLRRLEARRQRENK
ncbi:DNA binding transcription coactivator transcription factor [Haplosporangium sp. Z 767]|nr:DNA binding transcription coactivator transcription factor [Haplosporangium sp. Z 11]KAF9192957.1 DNA binding transcription coactivator transcription factor [Haplosporangium sp. Z 767]